MALQKKVKKTRKLKEKDIDLDHDEPTQEEIEKDIDLDHDEPTQEDLERELRLLDLQKNDDYPEDD